ncbi:MAG: prepilin-type N-terminal cleavage/methylation domain-containing protein [Planctomycetaceae bacterium]|nr:prepilin-type N-terminal cleavage/methylation domain-containing protein [Planctomycetaceae bacterium]
MKTIQKNRNAFSGAIAHIRKDAAQEIRAATVMERLLRFDRSVTLAALVDGFNCDATGNILPNAKSSQRKSMVYDVERHFFGLTLVELLVVISIIGIVLAASVPMIKPMLESNKVRDGADAVATYLNQARARAIEEGRCVGVRFERYTTIKMNDGSDYYPYNGAALVMRQVAVPTAYCGFTEGVRVAVDASNGIPLDNSGNPILTKGRLYFYTWNRGSDTIPAYWEAENLANGSELSFWGKLIQDGDLIQFDAQGPKYKIKWTKDGSGNKVYPYIVAVNAGDDAMKDQNFADNNWNEFPYKLNQLGDAGDDANQGFAEPKLFTYNTTPPTPNPVTFQVFRQPQQGNAVPTMAPPVVMPYGTVVDLDSSGMGENFYNEKYSLVSGNEMLEIAATGNTNKVVRDDFCAFGPRDKNAVTIMFLPSGGVDKVYYGNHQVANPNDAEQDFLDGSKGKIPSSPIFLCIGIWERSGFWEGSGNQWSVADTYLPESGNPELKRNYDDMKNYWVTVFPKNGLVRINRMSSTKNAILTPGNISASRDFAKSLHTTELK